MKTISYLIIACFIIVFSGCIKKDKDNPTPVDNSVTSMPLQFSGTLNSEKVSCAGSSVTDYETINNSYVGPGVSAAFYNCRLNDTSGREFSVGIGGLAFVTIAGAKKPDSISFKNYITAKNYNYPEVNISYNDKNGKVWFTTSDIDFKITEVKEERHHGNFALKFRAEFNGNLFTYKDPANPKSGLISEKIENGVFVGYFENK